MAFHPKESKGGRDRWRKDFYAMIGYNSSDGFQTFKTVLFKCLRVRSVIFSWENCSNLLAKILSQAPSMTTLAPWAGIGLDCAVIDHGASAWLLNPIQLHLQRKEIAGTQSG